MQMQEARQHTLAYGINDSAINYPGAPNNLTAAFSIVDSDIVEQFYDATGTHVFLDAAGTFTEIDDPCATPGNTLVFGINAAGQIAEYF